MSFSEYAETFSMDIYLGVQLIGHKYVCLKMEFIMPNSSVTPLTECPFMSTNPNTEHHLH